MGAAQCEPHESVFLDLFTDVRCCKIKFACVNATESEQDEGKRTGEDMYDKGSFLLITHPSAQGVRPVVQLETRGAVS